MSFKNGIPCEPAGVKSTVRIWHENLEALVLSDRVPLSKLAPESHIHGGLRLEIAGRLVPSLGYWGPDDVCFDEWLTELSRVAIAMQNSGGRHIYDEGEQGQPAFVFQRDGDRAFFSIITSEISDGEGRPDWQNIEFSPTDFLDAYDIFRSLFFAEVRAASPTSADVWLKRFAQQQPAT